MINLGPFYIANAIWQAEIAAQKQCHDAHEAEIERRRRQFEPAPKQLEGPPCTP